MAASHERVDSAAGVEGWYAMVALRGGGGSSSGVGVSAAVCRGLPAPQACPQADVVLTAPPPKCTSVTLFCPRFRPAPPPSPSTTASPTRAMPSGCLVEVRRVSTMPCLSQGPCLASARGRAWLGSLLLSFAERAARHAGCTYPGAGVCAARQSPAPLLCSHPACFPCSAHHEVRCTREHGTT